MLSAADNELITRVGRATPMGEALRRFWVPFLPTWAVEPGGAPQRIDLLGEELVVFCSPDGTYGLLERWCPHRGVDLSFGRNEDCGLRCIYHGWKFDHAGACLDLPNVPDGDRVKEKVTVPAYAIEASGGVLWAHLGDPATRPPFEGAPWVIDGRCPSEPIADAVQCEGNWVQHLEGLVDDSHVAFLHASAEGGGGVYLDTSSTFTDAQPTWGIAERTEFGALCGWKRRVDEHTTNLRLNIFVLPSVVGVPMPKPFVNLKTWQICTPLNDHSTMFLRVMSRDGEPLSERERELFTRRFRHEEGSLRSLFNHRNDYGMDRTAQRTVSFSGLADIRLQDMAVQEHVRGGLIADRTNERLVSSDQGVIQLRRRLVELASDPASVDGALAALRANRFSQVDVDLPADADFAAEARERGLAARTEQPS